MSKILHTMKQQIKKNIVHYLRRSKTTHAERAMSEGLMAALFAACSAAGVLPVSRRYHVNRQTHTHSDCFMIDGRLQVVTYFQLIITIYSAVRLHPFSTGSLLNISLWAVQFVSPLAALVLSSLSTPRLVALLSEACRVYSLSEKHVRCISSLYFSLMLLWLCLPMLLLIHNVSVKAWVGLFDLVLFNYGYTALTAIELLISCLCLVADRAHQDINRQVKAIKKKVSVKTFFLFKDLLERHLRVQQFVSDFARYSRLHFLNVFLTLKLRLIIYTVLSVRLIRRKDYTLLPEFAVHSLFVVARVFSLCYRCQRVKGQAAETAAVVRRLHVHWMEDLTDDQSELLEVYQQLLSASSVTFTASGLFEITIPQLMNVLGLIITYSLVAFESNTL